MRVDGVHGSLVSAICFFGIVTASGCNDGPEPLGELAAVEVTAGLSHTCARFASGAVACWGGGTLGDGAPCERGACSTTPVLVPGLTDAVSVSAGASHTCAARATGEVVCWGLSTWGDDALVETHQTPRAVAGISNAVAVSSGDMTTCALLAAGEVVCWGMSLDGLLGDGEETHEYCHPAGLLCSRTPVRVVGLADVASLSVGGSHACASRSSGTVACWGRDLHFIDETTTWSETHVAPVEIVGVSDATDVAAGDRACARNAAGTVRCWTAFDGDPPSIPAMPATPQVVSGLAEVVDLDLGGAHTCAVHMSGRMSCWGADDRGQIGDGGTLRDVPEPVAVLGIDDAVAVSAGARHTCAVRASGRLACWGENLLGQLGDGTILDRIEPVDVLWP